MEERTSKRMSHCCDCAFCEEDVDSVFSTNSVASRVSTNDGPPAATASAMLVMGVDG